MATRYEREKLQRVNEKHKNILAVILSREENKYCADCLAKGPRWASWNLGVLLCIRCSGLHRSLGVHISRVKSVNLDTWTKEQMVNFCSRGNGWAKDKYEAKLPREFKRPNTDSSLEYFIRDKYEKRKYVAPVEITLRSISDLGLLEDNQPENAQKARRKDQRARENVTVMSIAKPKGLHANIPGIPRPKSLPQLPKHGDEGLVQPSPNQHKPGTATDDLLGLSSPISMTAPVSVTVAAVVPPSADLTDDLFGPLSSHLSQSSTMTSSVSSPDLVNGQSSASPDPSPSDQVVQDKKMSKDSILSLYSQGTKAPSPNPLITGAYNVPPQNNLTYQQQPAMSYGQQSFQTMQGMNMQGMQGGYMNQQQMMAMQQQQQQQQQQLQQQQLQMQQMSQQMGNMNVAGMPGGMGYPMMAGQGQQNPMQNNMQFGMGYGAQPQVRHPAYSPQQQQQQMYGNVANGTAGMGQMQGMMQMGGYGGMSNTMMAAGGPGAMPTMGTMQGQPTGAAWGQGAVTPATAGMNSGHTLSNQLWK